MERTKNSEEARFQKIGGGSLYLSKGVPKRYRIIKPGQFFTARRDEIPEAFKDTVIEVGGAKKPSITTSTKEETTVVAAEIVYTVELRSPGWFDVKDSNGKRMNDGALRKADAEALVESLTK
jgi:hypothetical protein